jgi:hypothetical protein
MTRGIVVTDHADTRCDPRWFVGVITAPTKRANTGRPIDSAGDRRPVGDVVLVCNFVTGRRESWLSATPTGLCRCRMW